MSTFAPFGPPIYPAGPLLDALRVEARRRAVELNAANVAPILGCAPASAVRILAGAPITWERADAYAVRLGRHPAELWPDVWYAHAQADAERHAERAERRRAAAAQRASRRRASTNDHHLKGA